MRELLLACLIGFAAPAAQDAGDEEGEEGEEGEAASADTSGAPVPEPRPQETCKEILERVKQSDCIKPVARFLDGAVQAQGSAELSSEDLELLRKLGYAGDD